MSPVLRKKKRFGEHQPQAPIKQRVIRRARGLQRNANPQGGSALLFDHVISQLNSVCYEYSPSAGAKFHERGFMSLDSFY